MQCCIRRHKSDQSGSIFNTHLWVASNQGSLYHCCTTVLTNQGTDFQIWVCVCVVWLSTKSLSLISWIKKSLLLCLQLLVLAQWEQSRRGSVSPLTYIHSVCHFSHDPPLTRCRHKESLCSILGSWKKLQDENLSLTYILLWPVKCSRWGHGVCVSVLLTHRWMQHASLQPETVMCSAHDLTGLQLLSLLIILIGFRDGTQFPSSVEYMHHVTCFCCKGVNLNALI